MIAGPCTCEVTVPLERVPLFVRANALLPTIEPVERLTEDPWDAVTFDAYLLGRGRTSLRDVDGRTEISAVVDGSTLLVDLSGANDRIRLRVFPLAQRTIESVLLNGRPLTPVDWVVHNDGTLLVQLAQTEL